MTTEEVENIARDFVIARNNIKEVLRGVEGEQIKGMTTQETIMTPEEIKKFIDDAIADKHGKIDLDMPPADVKKTSGRTYKL